MVKEYLCRNISLRMRDVGVVKVATKSWGLDRDRTQI